MTHTTKLKNITLFASALALGAISVSSQAAEPGWYLGSTLSSIDVDDAQFNSNSLGPRNLTINSDSDVGFGGSVGYRFAGNSLGGIRLEGEFLYSEQDVEQINFNGNVFNQSQGSVDGEIEVLSGFINIAQEFDGLGYLRPYVGVGIGITQLEADFAYNPNLTANIDSDDDTAFSYQAFVGVDVDLSDRFTGYIDYRRIETDDLELNRFGGGAGGPATTLQEGEIEVDAITVGLRYSFK